MKNIALPLFLIFAFFSATCMQAQNTGVDTLSTINSFQDQGEFYSMDYEGDYSEILDWLDDQIATDGLMEFFDQFHCSLFSANGDDNNQILGRNFDNADNDVLLSRFSPPDAYASLAFTRMTDLGFAVGTNFEELSFEEMLPLLYAAYFVPDGINEHGLSAGLATVPSITYTPDPAKDTIFITRLIREILDHAQNVQEALAIANSYNVFDMNVNTLSHHLLVGTADNESLVIEFSNGAFQAIYPEADWQVVTNIPVYNVPIEVLRTSCWRFNGLYTILEDNSGILSWEEGLDALDQVHLNCPWSAIYDMSNVAMYFIVHNNYDDPIYVNLEDFVFEMPVKIPDREQLNNNYSFTNFPNPFSTNTTIHYVVEEGNTVTLLIYDIRGNKVKTLVDNIPQSGEQVLEWDKTNDAGSNVSPGIYFCHLKTGKESKTIKLIVEQ
jgi:hypothetical protein